MNSFKELFALDKALKLIYSVFGIGYVPIGSGTVCSIVPCLIIGLLGDQISILVRILIALLILVVAFISTNIEFDDADPGYVVIDEFLGMWISLILVPSGPSGLIWVLIAFILFRFFDITKLLGISRIEKLNGATGIVMDDVVAGLYALLIIGLLVSVF